MQTQMQTQMEWLVGRSKKADEIAQRLMAENPGMPAITAFIAASDIRTGLDMTEAVNRGEILPRQAVNRVGSFARFDWAIEHLPWGDLIEMLPDLWTGCDPDDTRPDYLQLWKSAWLKNGQRPLSDEGRALPGRGRLRVYRGQSAAAPLGFAWTLSEATAVKFARGAGVRAPMPDPVVYWCDVGRERALAYLTARGEDEIILDTSDIEKRNLQKREGIAMNYLETFNARREAIENLIFNECRRRGWGQDDWRAFLAQQKLITFWQTKPGMLIAAARLGLIEFRTGREAGKAQRGWRAEARKALYGTKG